MPGIRKAHDPAARTLPGVCEQLTYIHPRNAESAVPGAYSPTQSVGLGLGMPLHVAVTVPPRAMVVGLTVKLTPPTVKASARRQAREAVIGQQAQLVGARGECAGDRESARSRGPDAPGVCEQLTYIHARYAESAVPGAYSPTQSVGLGLGMPLHVAVTVPPRAMVVGLTVKLTPPTVKALLVARRVKPSLASRRSS